MKILMAACGWMTIILMSINLISGSSLPEECRNGSTSSEPWAIIGCGPRDGVSCEGTEKYSLVYADDIEGHPLGDASLCRKNTNLVYWTKPLAQLAGRETVCLSSDEESFDPKIVICSIQTNDTTTVIVAVVVTLIVVLIIAGVIFGLWKKGKLERCIPSRKQKPTAIELSPRTNGRLLEEFASDDDLIPHFVRKRVQLIEEMGLAKGIHRVHWNDPEAVTILDRSLEADPFLRADQLDWSITPHTVANSLSSFLRSLREPVIPRTMQRRVPSIMVLDNSKDRRRMAKEALADLPEVNRATLRFLMGHLRFVAERQDTTQMDERKIAAVFQPIMMDDWRRRRRRGSDEGSGSEVHRDIVEASSITSRSMISCMCSLHW